MRDPSGAGFGLTAGHLTSERSHEAQRGHAGPGAEWLEVPPVVEGSQPAATWSRCSPGPRGRGWREVHPYWQSTMSEMGSRGGRSAGSAGPAHRAAPPLGGRHQSVQPCGPAADSALGSTAALTSVGKALWSGRVREGPSAAVCVSRAPRLGCACGAPSTQQRRPAPSRGAASVSGKHGYFNDQGITTEHIEPWAFAGGG